MKKVLCFAAMAMAIFASCQKTEIVTKNDGPQEISFFAVNKVATKTPIENTVYPTDYDMKVAAYLAAGGTEVGDFFKGTTFENVPSENKWAGGVYWPLTYSKINFLAIAQPNNSYTGTGVGEVSTNFTTPYAQNATVTFKNNQVTNSKFSQFDLMYAAGFGDHSTTTPYPVVDMKFKHALSWINFTVAKNDITAGITINSIQLHGAHYGGTLTLTNTKYDATSTYTTEEAITIDNTNWTNHTTAVSNVFVPNTGATANADKVPCSVVSAPFGNGLMVVPKKYSSAYPSITINYTITMDDVSTTYNFDYVFALSGDFEWEPGKKYTYNITLNLQEIKIAPSVDTWADGESSTITI